MNEETIKAVNAATEVAAVEKSTTPNAKPTAPLHLYAAIWKLQGEIETVRKNGENPHFRSKYATLDEIWESIRKPVNKAGLIVFCTIEAEGGERVLTTHIAEVKSGEEIACAFPLAVNGSASPQALGSALTYARRYTLSTLLQIVTGDGADDDGEAASAARPTTTIARGAAIPQRTAAAGGQASAVRPSAAKAATSSLGF